MPNATLKVLPAESAPVCGSALRQEGGAEVKQVPGQQCLSVLHLQLFSLSGGHGLLRPSNVASWAWSEMGTAPAKRFKNSTF